MDTGMIIGISLCILMVLFFTFLFVYSFLHERKMYNNGNCTSCGKRMEHFSTDSQGCRGYCCSKCRHYVWISWKTVDKNFYE